MSRFDPDPTKPYASCIDCDKTFLVRTEMTGHLAETRVGFSESHRAMVTNPTRMERITMGLNERAEEAASEFVYGVGSLITTGGVTLDEISEAMRRVEVNFSDAWEQSR
jgi:hypothetical protein